MDAFWGSHACVLVVYTKNCYVDFILVHVSNINPLHEP